ncbi:MAG: tetratricopeptide repeat protein [Planctomycetota bacterium]
MRRGTSRVRKLALCLGVWLVAACGGESAPATTPPHAVPPPPAVSPPAVRAPVQQTLAAALAPAFSMVNEARFDEARERITELLAGEPGVPDYQAEFLLGYSYQKQKLYAQAKAHFLRAVELQPDYHPTHHFLGFAHYYLGEPGPARAAFLAHLEQRPDEGDDHFGIGLCDLDAGLLDEAARRFTTAIELHEAAEAHGKDRRKQRASCHARLGDVRELRGDLAAARGEYERAVTLWPAHYEVWHKLDRTLTRLGETELAAHAREQHALWRDRADASR